MSDLFADYRTQSMAINFVIVIYKTDQFVGNSDTDLCYWILFKALTNFWLIRRLFEIRDETSSSYGSQHKLI